MDINNLPKQSGRIKLVDIDPYLLSIEGQTTDETAAYVIIKVTDTDDNRRRDEMLRAKEYRYLNRADESLVFAEIARPTETEKAEISVYLALAEAGNLTIGSQPLFPVLPARKMEYEQFVELWRSIPLEISNAVYMAVLAVNRVWATE
jgi:hypothetical protein